LFVNRQKTESPSRVPLLPQPKHFEESIGDHPKCQIENRLFPLLAIKEEQLFKGVADKCDISREHNFNVPAIFATNMTPL
jgi:hypothetical protein